MHQHCWKEYLNMNRKQVVPLPPTRQSSVDCLRSLLTSNSQTCQFSIFRLYLSSANGFSLTDPSQKLKKIGRVFLRSGCIAWEGAHSRVFFVPDIEESNALTVKQIWEKTISGCPVWWCPSYWQRAFVFLFLRLSSAAVSKDAGLICGGFEDSSIMLWSLTPKKLVHPKRKPDISKIQLSSGI